MKIFEKYGRKFWNDMENMEESWIMKRYGKYGGKVGWIVKRYGKYGKQLWNDMENMEEK